MYQIVDLANNPSNWNMTNGSITTTTYKNLIAGGIADASLMVAMNSNSVLTRKFDPGFFTLTTDKLGKPIQYTEFVFSILSLHQQNETVYQQASDFRYKIQLDDTHVFFVPTYNRFTEVTISLTGITAITQITITPLFSGSDSLVLSNFILSKDQMPVDVFISAQEGIQKAIDEIGLNETKFVGYARATAGANSVNIREALWIDRYAAFKISDGVNSEVHQFNDRVNDIFNLSPLKSQLSSPPIDGKFMLNSFTTEALVTLVYPIIFGTESQEVVLPSISLWGLSPEFIYRGSKLEYITDTWAVGPNNSLASVTSRRQGQIKRYSIFVDVEGVQNELIRDMATAVERFLGRNLMWIDGKRHQLEFTRPATEIYPSVATNIIPKIQYNFEVEVKEELFDRVTLPILQSNNVSVNIASIPI